jgi:hypothetical protein
MKCLEGVLIRFVLGAFVVFIVAASPARADKCTGAKLKAVGKKESGLLSCQAKVAATGDSSDLSTCESKVKAKFLVAFAKAGTCVGNEAICENIADGCESTVAVALTDTFPSNCEASKRKAAGKLAQGELACYSKAAAKGVPVDTVTCIPRAQTKFSGTFTKAGACPDGGSPQTLVEDNCVQPAVTTDGGDMVIDVCPTTTTTTTTTTTSSTSTSSSTSSTTSTSSTSTTTSTLICGNFLTKWGSPGSGDGQFSTAYVYGVAVDGTGNVYIADSYNYRIQKFDNAGTFLTKWGSAGAGDGQFDRP